MLIFYFATTEVVPFAAAALVAWAVHRHGVALSGPAFAVACAFFLYHRSRLTGPLLCAGWVVISGIASSHIALAMLGETTPPVWLRGPIPGPAGMTTWIASVAVIAALLVVPRKRESRRRKRVKTIFEQLPP
jgi:hypothetical protein